MCGHGIRGPLRFFTMVVIRHEAFAVAGKPPGQCVVG
jgi:hypothetical protein